MEVKTNLFFISQFPIFQGVNNASYFLFMKPPCEYFHLLIF